MIRNSKLTQRLAILTCISLLFGASIRSLRGFHHDACAFDRSQQGLLALESQFHTKLKAGANAPNSSAKVDQESTGGEKLAYVTFLSDDSRPWWEFFNPFADHHDPYFTSVRMLAYQILYSPYTQTKRGIPFIVMVTKEVSPKKRQRLENDGAIIFQVDDIELEELAEREVGSQRWKDDLTKLRINFLTGYDRVLFLDCDMLLTRSLDGVFDEPAAQPQKINNSVPYAYNEHPPSRYVFAALGHATRDHDSPPTKAYGGLDDDYFNSGFMVLHPDPMLLRYYFTQIGKTDHFSWRFPQQNFLNYAHDRVSPIPWQMLPSYWNVVFPSLEDYEAGVASLHDKWWNPYDKRLKKHFAEVKKAMEMHYMAERCGVGVQRRLDVET